MAQPMPYEQSLSAPAPTANPNASVVPTDQFDQEVLRLVNRERTQRGLRPLTLSDKLDEAADLHSQDMIDQDYFSHRGLDGSSVGDRIEDAGYTEWNRWGENIDWYRGTAEEVVQGWMGSSGHRANILNRDYTHMGLGYAFDDDIQGDYRWTQVFAAGDPNPGQYVAETTGAPPVPTEGETIGEYGTLSLDHKWQTVSLDDSYINPVVIVSDPTFKGWDPATIRLREVGQDSFQIRLQEPKYKDDWHTKESVSYLVVEAGDWTLADGTRLSAGTHTSDLLTSQGFDDIEVDGFDDTPTVLSQVQTFNGTDWVTTRTKGHSANGFQIAMQEEEALNDGVHYDELLGWVAIEQGVASDGDTLLQGGITGRSHDHQLSRVLFEKAFDAGPAVIAKLGSYFGTDTANLRLDDIERTGFGVRVHEEQSLDRELTHTDESVAFLALENQSGTLTGISA